MYIARNDNLIIKPNSNVVELGNGLTVQEQRGKRDMMWGEVILAPQEHHDLVGTLVLYPVYAADKADLPINGEPEPHDIVKIQDIILVKTIDK